MAVRGDDPRSAYDLPPGDDEDATADGDEVTPSVDPLTDDVSESLPAITDLVRRRTGHDFGHYKRSPMVRRIVRRLRALHIGSVEQYLDRLRESDDEATQLFRGLLINVTSFFRDPEAFEMLYADVLLPWMEQRKDVDDASIRVWVPGCSTGEEAYSIAMLLHEAAEEQGARVGLQVFATDLDDRALERARRGEYTAEIRDSLSEARLERFFEKRGSTYRVKSALRETVLFSLHNLINDPPLSRIDLISCRNLLIYLGPHLQKKLIPLFHFSLREGGHLMLGPSESLTEHRDLFLLRDASHRIARRREVQQEPSLPWGGISPFMSPALDDQTEQDLSTLMRRIVVDEFLPRSVVVDEDGKIQCASADMTRYLTVGEGDFKNSVVNLAREGLRAGLRAAFSEATRTRRRVARDRLLLDTDEGTQLVTITVQPMPNVGLDMELFLVVFQDAGEPLDDDRGTSHGGSVDDALVREMDRELSTLRHEHERNLQSLESANEELKSSNEELLSMNEELQSANEELETSREDVQRANDALARETADLEELFRITNVATLFIDADGRILRFTPAAQEIYNLIPGDVGRPLEHVTHRMVDPPPFEIPVESSDEHEEVVLVRTTDGRVFQRRVLAFEGRERDRAGPEDGCAITFDDVTELNNTRRYSTRNLAELEILYESAGIGLAFLDLDSRFVKANSDMAALFGKEDDEILGHTPAEVAPLETIDTLGPILESVYTSGEASGNVEVRLRSRGGEDGERYYLWSCQPVETGGELIGAAAVAKEITDRVTAENRLMRSSRRLRLALEAGSMGTWRWEVDTDVLEFDAMERKLWGLRPVDSISGDRVIAMIHPDDVGDMRAAVDEAIREGEPYAHEFRIIRPDGSTRWISARGDVVTSRDRATKVMVGIDQDVTERRAAEETARSARLEAEAANRAKSEFLANMSHEIRTPMTAILGYADMLSKHVNSEENTELVETIRRNGRHLLEIINDILDLAKIESGQFKVASSTFAPEEIVEDVVSLMSVRASQQGVKLESRYLGDLPRTIETDATRLRQILFNLVGNAVKFTDDGTVAIEVSHDEVNQRIRFEVVDTGIGIAAGDLETLFEPFTQADSSAQRERGGTGLGLTICRRLSQALGGRIGAESRVGEGSRFTVDLPTGDLSGVERSAMEERKRKTGPAPVSSPAPLQSEALEGRRLLVVDDRAELRALVQMLLEEAGAEVETAVNGADAVSKLQSDRSFDVVLMDMQMPVMDGYAAAREIRKRGIDVPIIAVTAHALSGEQQECLEAGCSAYTTKPIDEAELLRLVSELVR